MLVRDPAAPPMLGLFVSNAEPSDIAEGLVIEVLSDRSHQGPLGTSRRSGNPPNKPAARVRDRRLGNALGSSGGRGRPLSALAATCAWQHGSMPQVTDDEAFRHVADAFRWLAAAERSVRDLRQGGLTATELSSVRALLPNVDVALMTSALVQARSLIEFFSTGGSEDPTSIRAVEQFGFRVGEHDTDMAWLLDRVPAMNKHLMHLTKNRERYERGGVDFVEWTARPGGRPGAVHEMTDRLVALAGKRQAATADPARKAQIRELVKLVADRRTNRTSAWTPTTRPLTGVPCGPAVRTARASMEPSADSRCVRRLPQRSSAPT
jgi:hypothetical protein